MIADGYTGRKGKGGFYRLNREGWQTERGHRSFDRRLSAGHQGAVCSRRGW
jgi:hypothetical protein